MIDDVHEPLETYERQFKDAHAKNTSDFFENLVHKSAVDEDANVQTVKKLRLLEQHVKNENSKKKWWRIFFGITIVSFLGSLYYVYTEYDWTWLFVPVLFFATGIYKLNSVINHVGDNLKLLQDQRDKKLKDAWNQLAKLNSLYSWDITAKLIQQTVPRIEFDSYFSNARLIELRDSFGWDGHVDQQKSVVSAHSGVLNGNPFVLAETRDHWMGTKNYHGSLDITWTERVKGSDGKTHTETRHETLHASVAMPFPEYENRKFIIFGNEAAPDLTFSRHPSQLSQLKESFFNNWRKRRAIKKLENKSRDLKGANRSFTIMSNQEFDALFGATNRNHEVQFRLLFTPLAQQEMLKLLKDKDVGYGDDFDFYKKGMINLIEPSHMRSTDIDCDPSKFYTYELAKARKFFNQYQNEFFKSFFFGLAPLLAIPLYQQHRSHADIYKDPYSRRSCYWEHETLANYFGDGKFNHPQCITQSILKTQATQEADGSQTVRVTANGYRGIDHVTYVSVHGGDGRNHDVPVQWTEYKHVHRESKISLKESDATEGEPWQTWIEQRGLSLQKAIHRRSILAVLIDD